MAVGHLGTKLQISIALAAAFLGPLLNVGYADETPQDSTAITLSVRAIQASEGREDRSHSDPSTQKPLHIDAALDDIKPKLANLPFTHFHLLSHKEETISLRQRNALQLPRGQSLTFRPIYMDSKKVGLWLNWRDKDGSEILNTRLHFDSHDSVLTGTDCSHNEGLILAIKAAPIGQATP